MTQTICVDSKSWLLAQGAPLYCLIQQRVCANLDKHSVHWTPFDFTHIEWFSANLLKEDVFFVGKFLKNPFCTKKTRVRIWYSKIVYPFSIWFWINRCWQTIPVKFEKNRNPFQRKHSDVSVIGWIHEQKEYKWKHDFNWISMQFDAFSLNHTVWIEWNHHDFTIWLIN